MSAATLEATEVFPPIIADAVRDSLKICFGSILGKSPVEKPGLTPDSAGCGVVGMLSLMGDPSWTMALAFPEGTAVAISGKFCGFEIPFDTPEMGDVIGELANVLGGEVVAQLDKRKIKAQMSLPMIAKGHNVEVMLPIGQPSMTIPYTTAEGNFWVKMAAARPGQAPGRRPGT